MSQAEVYLGVAPLLVLLYPSKLRLMITCGFSQQKEGLIVALTSPK